MTMVGTKMRSFGSPSGPRGLSHWCPACDEMHTFAVERPFSNGAQWTWDGNVEAPTFAPSMNIVTNPRGDPHHQPQAASSVCHYFLKAGVIQYLGDCTHAMGGAERAAAGPARP